MNGKGEPNSAAHSDARPVPCLINRRYSRAGGCERYVVTYETRKEIL
jgi:hypothetical protein